MTSVEQTLSDLLKEVAFLRVGRGSLGGQAGRNLEGSIRIVIERFSGISPLMAERLVLTDDEGEVFRPGAQVEFDASVSNGRQFLVEVKGYTGLDEMEHFARKAAFAECKLGRSLEKVILTLTADRPAVKLAEHMGIACYAASIE